MARRRRAALSDKPGTFDPEDRSRVKHTKVGVWDLYEEIPRELEHVPGASRIEQILEIKQNSPYLWRMMKDIASIRSCWFLLCTYALVHFILSLLPAVNLWFSGQMLTIVQTAVETRTVDRQLLLRIAAGRIGTMTLQRFLRLCSSRAQVPLERRLKQHFTQHIFRARARLDLPTFDDPAVQRQLGGATPPGGRTVAAQTLRMSTDLMSACVYVTSQLGVLVNVLREQEDGPLLAALMLGAAFLEHVHNLGQLTTARVWAATTKNDDYLRMQGYKRIVNDPEHRKELIAGNLAEYLISQFVAATRRLGDDDGDFRELNTERVMRGRFHLISFLKGPLGQLPQIIFTLRAAQRPASIPVSLASLQLIQSTANNFTWELYKIYERTASIAEQLADIRKLYNIAEIPNKITDGTAPFPEDTQKIRAGIELEFRNVSFRYPGADIYALQNISFKLLAGQLCVIVGSNGSGKSTILKLIIRLYDPEEGQILLDGKDIRAFKLQDLRQAISVLFQDYTHFPLSIRDNIALGDPEHASDNARIERAAELGGASEFIGRLPDGLDTYLERPVQDYYGDIPAGTHSLFGRKVDYGALRAAGGMSSTANLGLSGGQMQRLAVARTFMRSVVSDEPKVGLLLFDEPSASLDPTAEHDLFVRLRELRNNKTMLFSSHRFGNLTRHADIILYMNDSVIVESGTHEQLLAHGGEYARIWKLQAQAFL
ncbi:hypothetical protein CERSUDRAFT_109898 [Gelatoporia subvermispora B]|uniref:ABC transporter domain-containing protein n=1 Tax=Ceriporiopsis subvermispora (strain B) TaxID=914234 RepID=M2RS81_CERS8|nr:hypothetical protein CERSUDRAFT_109898 [Gelatoporia subvermispora B]